MCRDLLTDPDSFWRRRILPILIARQISPAKHNVEYKEERWRSLKVLHGRIKGLLGMKMADSDAWDLARNLMRYLLRIQPVVFYEANVH